MKQVIVFAGTTEGRILGEWLAAEGVKTLCCVATEYGKELMKPEPGLDVRQGRLNEEEMCVLFEKGPCMQIRCGPEKPRSVQ